MKHTNLKEFVCYKRVEIKTRCTVTLNGISNRLSVAKAIDKFVIRHLHICRT